ncbi:hypothetical protein BO71DRAFT_212580 [Aspergillus ellipticus CBS 707.79]|uniref:Uncharacterized protein n=1 Tax=Aspergillus ellipticus CBS 707.79 TaxID=1448320 RepID=A0A319EUW9_9EURO|nr:hypothetical protein BO71DRAFT_212580 [Aspergillus ellipticus CBS 707.79]
MVAATGGSFHDSRSVRDVKQWEPLLTLGRASLARFAMVVFPGALLRPGSQSSKTDTSPNRATQLFARGSRRGDNV